MKRLSFSKRPQGYSLMETLLVLGVASLIASTVLVFYRYVDAQQSRQENAETLQRVVNAVQNAYASSPTYQGLSHERLFQEDFYKQQSIRANNQHAFLGDNITFRLTPAALQQGSTVVENGAVAIVMEGVTPTECVILATNFERSATSILVGPLTLARQTPGNTLNLGQLSEACGREGPTSMALVFPKPLAQRELTQCIEPAPQAQEVSCEPGQIGRIVEERSGSCVSPQGEVLWGPWQVVEDTCVDCPTQESRTLGCPPGQTGSITETRAYDCSAQAWGPWTTQMETCTPCPTSESRPIACPTGMGGSGVETRHYQCAQNQWGPWMPNFGGCS